MNANRWILAREPEWSRLESLLSIRDNPLKRLTSTEVREMALLYRSASNDLAKVATSPDYQHLKPYLNNLVQRVHAHVYEKPPTRVQDMLHFVAVQFPQAVRKNMIPIGLAMLMFILGGLVAMATVKLDPETETYFMPPAVIDGLRHGHLWMDDQSAAPSQSSFLMTNNIRVAFNAYVGGLFFGVGSIIVLLFNGMIGLGGPFQVAAQHGLGPALLLFVMPHGVIELSTIFIAGGGGLMLGHAMLFPGDQNRWVALRERARESFVLILGCIPLLIIAGLIEGMFSMPHSLLPSPPLARVAVSVTSAILLLAYLGLSGREKKT